MKPVIWMAGASVGSWATLAAIVGRRTGVEILFGMLGPLVAVSGTWILAERILRRQGNVELTALLLTAFVFKMVFFGTYVAVMLRVVGFRPTPFVASFTGYFIALYLIGALYMKRLFSQRSR